MADSADHCTQASGNLVPPWQVVAREYHSANPLPTDVAALNSKIDTLEAELKAITSINTHLAAYISHLQAEQATPTATTARGTPDTTPTTPTATTAAPVPALIPIPVPCPPPNHPLNTAPGRGAGSPEVFKQITKTNWHGRLGRAHMVDVDALSTSALMELDSLLRRKLHAIFPRGGPYSDPDADTIFASLAALGLRLEDRGAYVDVPQTADNALRNAPMLRRGRDFVAWYYHGEYVEYWRGLAVETLLELARYRGLFDDEGYLLRVE